ncbi:hypothetical protein CTAYLR_001636 [Chrysophaeum taylorii]|uniref:Ion transport domain-containing protein n=1 Tax=Chrysophaeum taylorii TaxID=2483200 RepID=A0AAD7UBU8_9STRA|nr:hypothetical protein CTAYLR_001636 [Chrysophaeum taylorii]
MGEFPPVDRSTFDSEASLGDRPLSPGSILLSDDDDEDEDRKRELVWPRPRRTSITYSHQSSGCCEEVASQHAERRRASVTTTEGSTAAYPRLYLGMYTLCRATQMMERGEEPPPTALVEASGVNHLCRVCATGGRRDVLAHGPLWPDAGGPMARQALESLAYKPVLLVDSVATWGRCASLLDKEEALVAAILLSEDAAKEPGIDQAARNGNIPVVLVQPCDVPFFSHESPAWVSIRLDSKRKLLERRAKFLARLEEARALRDVCGFEAEFEARLDKAMESAAAKEFLAACHRGHVEAIEILEQAGVDARKVRDKRGRSGLMLAAACGRVKIVRALGGEGWWLHHRRDRTATYEELEEAREEQVDYVNDADNEGRTAVMHAVLRNEVRALDALLTTTTTRASCLANPRLADSQNVTPLERAIKRGFSEAAIQLLARGAWEDDHGIRPRAARSAYRTAVDKGMDDVVRALYAAQVEAAADGDSGELPGFALLYAIREKKMGCVDALLDSGIRRSSTRQAVVNLCDANYRDPDDGRTPLIEAAVLGDAVLVKKLARYVSGWPDPWFGGERLVDLDCADAEGLTALMHAAARGFDDVSRALCRDNDHRLETNKKSVAEGRTALHFAAHSDVEQPAIVRDLCVYAKADVDARDNWDQTPLHLGADRKNAAVVKELLMQNANVYALDAAGNTPLHLAARVGAKSVVAILLQNGARLDAPNYYWDTPLHVAILLHHTIDLNLDLRRRTTTRCRYPRDEMVEDEEEDLLFNASSSSRVSPTTTASPSPTTTSSATPDERKREKAVEKLERGQYTGVVEQLLQHKANLKLANRDGLEAFSDPLMQQYFSLKEHALNRLVDRRKTWMRILRLKTACWRCLRHFLLLLRNSSSSSSSSSSILPPGEGGAPHRKNKNTSHGLAFSSTTTTTTTTETRRRRSGTSGTTFTASSSPFSERSYRHHLISRAASVMNVGGGVLVRETTRTTTADDDVHGGSDLGQIRVQRAVGAVWQREVVPSMRRGLLLSFANACCLAALATRVASGGSSEAPSQSELSTGLRRLFEEEGPAAARSSAAIGFEEIKTKEDWYEFMRTTFYLALKTGEAPHQWRGGASFPLDQPIGQTTPENRTFLSEFGLLVGAVRVQQWRSDPTLCEVPSRYDGTVRYCYRSSTTQLFSRSPYSVGIKHEDENDEVDVSAAFRWRSGRELRRAGVSHRLRLGYFPAGGFALDLAATSVSPSVFAKLESFGWIDAATRAVAVELTAYSANTNLFYHATLGLEFPAAGGGGVPRFSLDVARLFPYDRPDGVLALEGVCGLFALWVLWRLVERVKNDFLFVNPWTAMDLALTVLFGAYVGTRLGQLALAARVDDWTTRDAAVSVARPMAAAKRNIVFLSALCWVAWFRVVEFLRIWKRAAILVLDITAMTGDLAVFVVLLGVVCMAFASASHVLRAWYDAKYATALNSMGYAMGAAFGEISYSELLTSDDEETVSKGLALLYVLIVLLLLMNMLVAVLIDQKTTRSHVEKRWCLIRLEMIRARRAKSSSRRRPRLENDRDVALLRKLEQRVHEEMRGSPITTTTTTTTTKTKARGPGDDVAVAPPSYRDDDYDYDDEDLERLHRDCLGLCDRVLRSEEPTTTTTPEFARRAKFLYPELTFFEDPEELDAKIRSFRLVAVACGQDWEGFRKYSDLEEEDLKFITENLKVSSARELDAAFATLAIANLGKIRGFADYVETQAHARSVDHDVTVANALVACPHLLKSYERLARCDPEAAAAVKHAACGFNLGQFVQGESVAASLRTAAEASPFALRLALLDRLSRIPSCFERRVFQDVREACEALLLQLRDVHQIYDAYFSERARRLRVPRDIVRLAAMCRVSTKAEARPLLAAFDALHREDRDLLRSELAKTGTDDWAILVRYAPGFLAAVAKLEPSSTTPREEGQVAAYACALQTLVQLYVKARRLVADHSGAGVYTLSVRDLEILATCLNETRGTVADFREKAAFTIEHTGNEGYVTLKNHRSLYRARSLRTRLEKRRDFAAANNRPASPVRRRRRQRPPPPPPPPPPRY